MARNLRRVRCDRGQIANEDEEKETTAEMEHSQALGKVGCSKESFVAGKLWW